MTVTYRVIVVPEHTTAGKIVVHSDLSRGRGLLVSGLRSLPFATVADNVSG